jgi:hypothetical protein
MGREMDSNSRQLEKTQTEFKELKHLKSLRDEEFDILENKFL